MSFNANLISGNVSAATATYVEDEVLMPKALQRNEVPALIGLQIQHPKMHTLVDKYSSWHLAIKSNTDIINLDDSDCIDCDTRYGSLLTSGKFVEDSVQRITYPAPIPISSAKLYFAAKQDTGSTHVYRYRLWLVPRFVKGVQQQNNVSQTVQF